MEVIEPIIRFKDIYETDVFKIGDYYYTKIMPVLLKSGKNKNCLCVWNGTLDCFEDDVKIIPKQGAFVVGYKSEEE